MTPTITDDADARTAKARMRTVTPIPMLGSSDEGVTDRFGRVINYLRVSLTDMCNLRCVYCMPADMVFRPPDELMQDEELLRLIGMFAGA